RLQAAVDELQEWQHDADRDVEDDEDRADPTPDADVPGGRVIALSRDRRVAAAAQNDPLDPDEDAYQRDEEESECARSAVVGRGLVSDEAIDLGREDVDPCRRP